MCVLADLDHYGWIVAITIWSDTYRSDLEDIVGAPVVNVVTHTGHKESEDFYVIKEVQTGAVLKKAVAVVSDREGVDPVVVGRITVTLLHT